MSDDEPKSDAERQRDYHARSVEARRANAEAERQRIRDGAGRETRDQVEAAIEAAKWLTASDAANLMQARQLARVIDEAMFSGDDRLLLSAHGRLSRVLEQMGGTPTARMARELRSRRSVPGGVTPDAESDEGGQPAEGEGPGGNVSQFQRPPKRRA